MMHYILFILLSTLIFAQNSDHNDHEIAQYEEYTPPPQVCYLFKKEDFNHTSNIVDDLILDVASREYIGFKFSSSRKSFSGYYGKFFECVEQESNHFECSRWDSIEKMDYYMKDDAMYLHIDYLQVSTEDDSLIHHIKSKDHHFVKGTLAPCYLPMEAVISVDNVKNGSLKDQLLHSITIKDVIIYDLAFHKDLVIAVGEDNSPKTREYQSQDEHHESLILRSTNGGKTWERVGPVDSIPHDHVIVLDEEQIVIASSIEGAGGEILTSSDGGKSWKNTYSGGMIESLKQEGNKITFTDISGIVLTSKDGGESWKETVSQEQSEVEEEEEIESKENNDESHLPSFLTSTEYRIDYETNSLIVEHRKGCCDALSISLIYNQSNKHKGILGPYWSLGGIESKITLTGDNELLIYNSYKGKVKRYLRSKDNPKLFYHRGSSKIEESKDGYIIKCDRSTHHFGKNGHLKKIVYNERYYTLHYEENRLHQIIEHTKEKQKPYLTFSYPFEGVSITLHDTKSPKQITFIKNSEKLLSNIVEGSQHIFHYTYSEDNQGDHRLWEIKDMTKSYLDRRVLKFEFDYFGNERMTIHDFRQKQNGYIEEKSYYHHAQAKESMSIVNTLTKYLDNGTLTDVNSYIDTYHFNYYDKEKKSIASTRHGKETYGFDKVGRVNFHEDEDGNVSLTYSEFNKIENSLVYQDDQPFEYTYLYTNDSNHYLRKLTAPQEEITLSYNDQGLIKELRTTKYHLLMEYDKNKKTKKIIVPKKGEIITDHDSQSGELISIDTLSYDKNITTIILTDELTRAMQTLKDRVSEGSIKNYPKWIW